MSGELVVRELLTQLGVKADVANVKLFGAAVNQVKQGMNSAVSVGNSLSVALGQVLATAAQRGFAALVQIAKGMLAVNFEAERLNASLITITGSQEAAVVAFDQIKEFTGKTPFALNNVTEAWIRLANVGIEPTERVMKSVGNTAAAFGRDIVEFADAVVGASTGEMEMLKRFGVVAKQAGNTVEFTFRGVKTKVKKDAASISEFLFKLGETKFAGSLERQMQTLPGLFSNLKDNVSLFFLTMGKKGGLNDALRNLIKTLIGVTAAGRPLAVTLGRLLARQVNKLTAAIIWLRKNSTLVQRTLKQLGAVIAVFVVGKMAKALKGLTLFSAGLKQLAAASALPTLKFALMAAAILLVLLAIEDIVGFMQGKDSLIGDLLSNAQAANLRKSIGKVMGAFEAGINKVNSALAKWDLTPLDLIAAAISIAVLMMAEFIELTVSAGEFLGRLAGLMSVLWTDVLPQAISDAWAKIVEEVEDFDEATKELIADTAQFFEDVWNAAVDSLAESFMSIADFMDQHVLAPIQAGWESTIGLITELIDDLVEFAEDSFGVVLDAGEKTLTFLGLAEGGNVIGRAAASAEERTSAIREQQASAVIQGLTVIMPGAPDSGLSGGDIVRGVSDGVAEGVDQALRNVGSTLF